MVITEVRIKLMEDHNENERLQAFCSVTFDNAFVVRDLKIIEGAKGYFVAMPSRKLSDRCQQCGCKNHLRSRFCNYCGSKLDEDRATRDAEGRAKLHADIAHPINSSAREVIQNAVLMVEQKYAAAGVAKGTGAQKLAEVMLLAGDAVTSLLQKAGINADSDYIKSVISAVVGILNVQGLPAGS